MKFGLCHKCIDVITEEVRPGVSKVVGCKKQPGVKGTGSYTCPLVKPEDRGVDYTGMTVGYIISAG